MSRGSVGLLGSGGDGISDTAVQSSLCGNPVEAAGIHPARDRAHKSGSVGLIGLRDAARWGRNMLASLYRVWAAAPAGVRRPLGVDAAIGVRRTEPLSVLKSPGRDTALDDMTPCLSLPDSPLEARVSMGEQDGRRGSRQDVSGSTAGEGNAAGEYRAVGVAAQGVTRLVAHQVYLIFPAGHTV